MKYLHQLFDNVKATYSTRASAEKKLEAIDKMLTDSSLGIAVQLPHDGRWLAVVILRDSDVGEAFRLGNNGYCVVA
jgi:hypothetical protein